MSHVGLYECLPRTHHFAPSTTATIYVMAATLITFFIKVVVDMLHGLQHPHGQQREGCKQCGQRIGAFS